SNLVYNYRNHSIFSSIAIGSIFFSSSVVEGNHWIFHSITCLYTYSNRIWIWYCKFAIYSKSMSNSFSTVFTVKSIGLFAVITHSHYIFTFYIYAHSIPYKFTRATPCKVAYIIGFIMPSFFLCSIFISNTF